MALFDVYVHDSKFDKNFWLKMWRLCRFMQEMGFKRKKGYLQKMCEGE